MFEIPRGATEGKKIIIIKITNFDSNFNDFAFVLGMVIFGQVGFKSLHRDGGKPKEAGLSPP